MRTRTMAVLAVAAVALMAAGCGDDDPAPAPEPSPAAPSPTPAGQVAECVTGSWRTTGVSGEDGGGAAGWELNGGGGVGVVIGADGAVDVDFSAMQPVDFAARVADVDVAGRFSYSGRVAGAIRTDGDTTGAWEPEGQVDWSGLRLTVDLTEPVQARPLDEAPVGDGIAELAEETGGTLDVNPFLGTGSYRCAGDTLVLTQDDDRDTTWTLRRA